jgi:flagellar biosynthetic protein FlhB
MDAASKTEAPTAFRRRELREQGTVLRSPDVTAALSFLAALLVLRLAGPHSLRRLLDTMSALMALPDLPSAGPAVMVRWLTFWLAEGMKAALPLALACLLVGLAANFAQVGFLATARPLSPDITRLNPISGAARLFSKRLIVETFKALIKIALIGLVAFGALRRHLPSLTGLANMHVTAAGTAVAGMVFETAARVCVIFIVVAAIDYLYQRFEFEQKIKMSREELREELKRTEGDPHIRARRRQRYRETIFQAVTPAIREANVVITNPTTYAVALRYDRREDAAPVVVAKGRHQVAQRILRIADRLGIPVVQSPPLARALYRSVRVGQEVPAALYRAVAEILVVIYRQAAERRRRLLRRQA